MIAVNNYLIHNGKTISTSDDAIAKLLKKGSVYEVFRVIDGVPLFFEEHLSRMYQSAELTGIELCLAENQIKRLLQELMDINGEYNSNVKLLFSEGGSSYYLYFIHTFYPTPEMYQQGIHTVIYDVERYNPNAKINNYQLREDIRLYREKRGAYEALLVNGNQLITEGSRSNIFFVDGSSLYTAPHNRVLMGITRSKVIEVAEMLSIPVHETQISVADLGLFNGAFITSTSNSVLPVISIDTISYQSAANTVIMKVKAAYEQEVSAYVAHNKQILDTL